MGLEQVKLLALDFDGVLTDNHVWTDQDGRESVRCYRGDGIGIERVKALGVLVVVISKEVNPVVRARCDKLSIPCYQGIDDKLNCLDELRYRAHLGWGQVAYVGNDINDLECLRAVGFPFVPKDVESAVCPSYNRMGFDNYGHEYIQETVYPPDYRFQHLRRRGGDGCVREVCDLIASAIEAGQREAVNAAP